jgi:hypothetical protein
VRGRERQAIQGFSEVFGYNPRLQQDGEIESFETVLLEPHGGELGGFILLRGDQGKLARIRASDEFQRHITRGLLTVEHLAVVGASLGGQITTLMSLYAGQLAQLA